LKLYISLRADPKVIETAMSTGKSQGNKNLISDVSLIKFLDVFLK